MTGREIAVCLIAAATVAAPAGIAAAFATVRRQDSVAVLFLGAGALCGVYAVIGWAWLLYGALR